MTASSTETFVSVATQRPRSDDGAARAARAGRTHGRRRVAAGLVGCVLGLGPASPGALAQMPPECTVEVSVEAGSRPPASTVPGTCSTSATSGTFSAPGIQSVAAPPLPATGSGTRLASAAAAVALATGIVLRRTARRPRAS